MAVIELPSLISRTEEENSVSNVIYVNLSDGTDTLAIDGSGNLNAILAANSGVDIGDVDILSIAAGDNNIGNVDIVTVPAPLSTTGGGTEATALRVTIANDSTGVLTIDDGGGSITVDGTVTTTSTFDYDEDTVHSTGDTGAFVLAVRNDTLAALAGTDGDYAPFQVNADGALYVAVDGTVTVTATNLDIRDLTHVSDSVTIGDGTETLNITAAGEAEVDIAAQSLTALKISKDANANSETNPLFVYTVNTIVSGNEVHDYDTATVTAASTDTHNYSVVGTTFLWKSFIGSASGPMYFTLSFGPTAGTADFATVFLTGREGDTQQVVFDPAKECPGASTGVARVVTTNRHSGQNNDKFTTIIGSDVA